MIISLNKWRISCEGIFSQNIIRMKAWNSASRKKNKSYWLCPAAVYWYLNSHVTTEEFWERCFSSCHERGTNKKFWVPMRNRKYQNKSLKHCHSFLKRNAMDFHKQLKSWKRLKNRGICLQEKFFTPSAGDQELQLGDPETSWHSAHAHKEIGIGTFGCGQYTCRKARQCF